MRWNAAALLVGCLAEIAAAQALEIPREQQEFFEAKIRPVLVQHCYECHSGKTPEPKGGLRLDTRTGLLKGGDSGTAIEPGKPDESLLIDALKYGAISMPPKGKLPDAVVADFVTWVKLGAPDPRKDGLIDPAAKTAGTATDHWSVQPLTLPAVPAVKDTAWAKSPIDRFVLAKLEANGLTPSPAADKRTLLKRVYIDLIGLPPTAEQGDAFLADERPEAFGEIVDELLASPRYGERWGRHWLDVARFADTKDGVLMYGDDRIRPYAYTYRDYVIRAFNEDLPYDRFVHEQLAADLIEPKVEPWRLAALGFVTLGRMFDNNIHDVIDDRIDTVTRGFLGLTAACARCHDHKYDPIPTADYYSLYGVFASCDVPVDLPLIEPPESLPGGPEFEQKLAAKRQELQTFIDQQSALLSEQVRERVGDYLVHVATSKPDPLETAIFFLSLAPEDLRPQIVSRWRRLIERRAKPDDPVFGLWHALQGSGVGDQGSGEWGTNAEKVVGAWLAKPDGVEAGQINPLLKGALTSAKFAKWEDVPKFYGDLLKSLYAAHKAAQVNSASPPVVGAATQQLLDLVIGPESPGWFAKSQTYYYMSRQEKDAFGGKKQELDRMAVQSPSAPPRAMVLADLPDRYDPRIFVRGNASQPGDPVPRQFVAWASPGKREPFAHGSGRLDLAQAITAPDNPLTTRVLVNRVWMHHFVEPLVSTPSDFGTRSTPPVHPELLDWLAVTFQQDGWSLKKLHRRIVLSAAWQQASFDRPEARAKDPDNRFLWRMNRRRLEFEAMRDTLLAVSGKLEERSGGRPVDIVKEPLATCRTVYALVDRQSLPTMFRAFDFANPDTSIERRPQTTVPQQALFAMNSPFLLDQAKALTARPELPAGDKERIAWLYRRVLQRPPTEIESSSAKAFMAVESGRSQLDKWEQLAQVLLMTNEMLFVD